MVSAQNAEVHVNVKATERKNKMISSSWVRHLTSSRLWLVPLIASLVLYVVAQNNFLIFHVAAEWFAIFITLVMFTLAWSTYDLSRNSYLTFLACGYVWVGMLDFGHTLVYKDMHLLVVDEGNLASQFWIATRYLEAFILILAPLFAAKTVRMLPLLVLIGLIALSITLMIATGVFPTTFVEGSGLTPFKIYSEYTIIALLGLAFVILVFGSQDVSDEEKALIAASIVFTMIAELFFTFYVNISDLANVFGHLFKIFSYWMIFQAVVRFNLRKPYVEQSKLSHAVEQSASSVMITDKHHIIEYVNATFVEKSGYDSDDLIGVTPFSIMFGGTDEDKAAIEEQIKTTLYGYQKWVGRIHIKSNEGASHWFKFTISPIHDETGVTTNFVYSGEDESQHQDIENILADPNDALQNILFGSLEAIAKLVEARDPYTAGHSTRVVSIARTIAKELGLPAAQIEAVSLSAAIHDIGKIKIPMEILNKPGRISKEEFALIKAHPTIGYETIKLIPFPWDIPNIILCHHENWDGSGYPNGLSGNDIPLESQILSIADVFEAVSAHRPYRPALGTEHAIEIIREASGTKYNPQVVDAVVRLYNQGNLVVLHDTES